MSCCNSQFCCKNKIESSYIKWLLEVLGPVFLGSKPAEIINISFTDVNREEKINDIYKYLYKCKKIDFIVIDKEKKGLKILFVNKKALSEKLKCKKTVNFLKFLGYKQNTNVNAYLEHLVDKLKSDVFPDEIGIFLGYPLKDVTGFMGYSNYEVSMIKYWKVYGDTKQSEDTYSKFLLHRKKMRKLLDYISVDKIVSCF
ncbi:DUF3793 family protein [Clostridioides difficile]|nr:DUF3793 family protein [Clostridioides difficile]